MSDGHVHRNTKRIIKLEKAMTALTARVTALEGGPVESAPEEGVVVDPVVGEAGEGVDVVGPEAPVDAAPEKKTRKNKKGKTKDD